MKKSKLIVIILIAIAVLAVGGFLIVSYVLDKDVENMISDYGTVKTENVTTLVAKFNTEVTDSGLEYPASDDYFAVSDELYWYGLYEDIYLYIEPVNYTDNRDDDIVDMSAIHFPKNSEYQDEALEFVRCLIKANNNDLTDEEIDNLIEEAQELSSSKQVANNGKGITVGLSENDTTYEYQIVRLYNK